MVQETLKTPTITVNRSSSFKSVKPPRPKKSESVSRNGSFSFLSSKPKTHKKRLTLDVLQALTPYQNGVDKVTEEARALLVNSLHMRRHVHTVFFPEALPDSRLQDEELLGFPVDRLATSLVAEAISRADDTQKFHCTIDRTELDGALSDIYTSMHWKKLGFALYTKLYPTVVKDTRVGVCLKDFIEDDGHEWAERILDNMLDPGWTLLWLQKIIRGVCSEEEYNREMNALFVKIHLLDPQSVIPAFHFLMNQRALPAVNLELATRTYLGGPLDFSVFIPHVQAAILKTSLPVNVSKLSLSDVEVFCGVEVDEFIVTECRNIGVWNGERPDNHRRSTVKERCSVM